MICIDTGHDAGINECDTFGGSTLKPSIIATPAELKLQHV